MRKFFFNVLAAVLILMSFSCNGKKTEKIEVGYRIYEPTCRLNEDGEPERLIVNFDGSVAKLEDVDNAPSVQITITPNVNGKWIWKDDSQLRFTPSEKWSLSTKYKVTFPPEIFADHVSVKNEFTFKTENFSTSLSDADFYINPENPEEKKATCTLRASHPLKKDNVSDFISVIYEYKDSKGKATHTENKAFQLSFSKDGLEAYIVTENLPIPPYTSSIRFELKKGIEALAGAKSTDSDSAYATVPGMSDYVRLEDISTSLVKNNEQNYDQMLVIETKGAVAVEELLNHITVYELPKDLPAQEGWNAVENNMWSTSEVTEKVLSMSEKIPLEAVPTPEPASTLNSFVYRATQNRYLYVKITGNIDFFGGYKLNFKNDENISDRCIRVPAYPKELSIMSEGTILSLSGSRKMALYSRGIEKAYFRLSRIMPKDVNHLVSMSNGSMKNFQFDNWNFNENNIAESETSEYRIPDSSESKISYFSYDFSEKLIPNSSKNLKNGLFLFQVTEKKSDLGSSYTSGKSDKRLILVTDLGFIVKKNTDNTRDIFVQSISSGNPVSGANVRVIGLNGNTLVSAFTDSSGHTILPATEDYVKEHRPTAFVVETSNDLSFMPYSEYGRSLDYSNYDVGGEYGKSDPKRISAYMFSDRGMYRPGETVHMAFIAKAGDWNINLKGTPVEAEVKDVNGSVIFNKKLQLSSSGFEGFDFATQDYSPTGTYNVNLYLLVEKKDRIEKNYLTSETVKIEEFIPDTLSISTNFEPLPGNGGWINPDTLKGNVSLKNLFGTPAAGNEVKAQLTLNPGFPVLSRYSDYYFTDPFYKDKTFEEYLGTKQTDEKGEASYDIDLQKYEKATYRLSFYAEGFEKNSGRSVSNQSSLYVSPLKYLIGYKADGKLDYINSSSTRKLKFIAIDQNLNQIDLDNVTLAIEDIRYISTLVKQSNGLYKYQSVKKTYPVETKTIKISKNGTEFTLPSETPGEYKLTLTNSEGLVFNTVNYTIVGEKNISRSLTRTAELELKLESKDLNPGSVAQLFIKAPYEGTGLITVERDHVYTHKWFKTNGLSSVQTIQIPENLEGNGYINVMFTRSISSKEIFMSPFCYGAVPFSVGKDKRTNKIKLSVPEEVRSGKELKIDFSTSDSGKIAIFAIDEGILQVAKYRTPNPLSQFFKKRALEVRTTQILDLILPEFNILKTLGATGGGAGMEMLAKNLNPFKRKQNASVAYWSGIIEAGPETQSVTYKVPDYFNGSLRVMAVAVSKDKMGVAQVSTLARNPLIIVPNVPLAAAPGDEFDVSVTVTNNHKGSGNNKITLKAVCDNHLEISGEKSASFTIAEGKDATATFKVKAKDVLGGAEIKFTASDESESSTLSSTLSVHPSMPYQVWMTAGSTKKSKAEADVNHRLYDEYAERTASVSNVPTAFLDGLNIYLAKYPYGCAEQVTSKAYPYLYEDFVRAAGKTRADAEKMVGETVGILQSRMKSDGNIGYWTSKSEANSYITLYCFEFLTDALAKGFYVPDSMFKKVSDAVKKIASKNDDSSYGIYLRSYAIYALTKNAIVTTSYIEKLENDMTRKNFSAYDYEGLYLAASYAMLKQDKQANSILGKIKIKKIFDSSWAFHNNLHYIATYIDVIASHFPSRISDIKEAEINELCNYLSDMSSYNTMSTASAIRAFESYAYTDKSEVYKAYAVKGKEEKEIALSGEPVLKGTFSDDAEKILFTSDKTMPLYYGVVQAGFEKAIPSSAIKDGLEVYREYLSEDGGKLSSIKVGDTITVKVSFRSLKGSLNNIAMVDMSPAGFETDIPSIRGQKNGNWTADYVDIREDRIVIYGTVTEKVNTFTYKAKAVASGKFVVPPMFAESMYNKEIRSISPQPSITIEAAK